MFDTTVWDRDCHDLEELPIIETDEKTSRLDESGLVKFDKAMP